MGSFLSITSDTHYAKDIENVIKLAKVEHYITKYINDMKWQESISAQLREIDSYHVSVSVILRLFRRDIIKDSNLKSITRYYKAKQRLRIDQMLDLDAYLDLPENEIRKRLCDDIFSYLEEMLKKYQKLLHNNLDVTILLPLLRERIEAIKNEEFLDDFYETQLYQRIISTEELKKKIESEGV